MIVNVAVTIKAPVTSITLDELGLEISLISIIFTSRIGFIVVWGISSYFIQSRFFNLFFRAADFVR
jgi:hypothetical protein